MSDKAEDMREELETREPSESPPSKAPLQEKPKAKRGRPFKIPEEYIKSQDLEIKLQEFKSSFARELQDAKLRKKLEKEKLKAMILKYGKGKKKYDSSSGEDEPKYSLPPLRTPYVAPPPPLPETPAAPQNPRKDFYRQKIFF